MSNRTKASLVILVVGAALIGLMLYLRVQPAPQPTHATTSHATTKSTTRSTSAPSLDPETKLPWIDAAALPKEGRDTLALIDQGGPFPYPNNDGVVFSNAEGHLPKQKSGYYHEYTVKTPGSPDRGPRRIVTGAGREYFYTDDHYASFSRIRR